MVRPGDGVGGARPGTGLGIVAPGSRRAASASVASRTDGPLATLVQAWASISSRIRSAPRPSTAVFAFPPSVSLRVQQQGPAASRRVRVGPCPGPLPGPGPLPPRSPPPGCPRSAPTPSARRCSTVPATSPLPRSPPGPPTRTVPAASGVGGITSTPGTGVGRHRHAPSTGTPVSRNAATAAATADGAAPPPITTTTFGGIAPPRRPGRADLRTQRRVRRAPQHHRRTVVRAWRRVQVRVHHDVRARGGRTDRPPWTPPVTAPKRGRGRSGPPAPRRRSQGRHHRQVTQQPLASGESAAQHDIPAPGTRRRRQRHAARQVADPHRRGGVRAQQQARSWWPSARRPRSAPPGPAATAAAPTTSSQLGTLVTQFATTSVQQLRRPQRCPVSRAGRSCPQPATTPAQAIDRPGRV